MLVGNYVFQVGNARGRWSPGGLVNMWGVLAPVGCVCKRDMWWKPWPKLIQLLLDVCL